jgi:hypothetical protein
MLNKFEGALHSIHFDPLKNGRAYEQATYFVEFLGNTAESPIKSLESESEFETVGGFIWHLCEVELN